MAITVSAMELRQRVGEILNRVNLVHDQFIIERNGKPLAAIVPLSSLEDIQVKARKKALSFLDEGGATMSDEEAANIAISAVKEVRAEKHKKKVK